jgi:hypothetical protein
LADESKSSQFERYLSLGASVVAPITIISALLFYFGYVSSRAQYAYFGIDVDTIGLSTQDYVMRSPQPLLVPLLVLVMIAVALVALHLWVTAWLGRARPERARIVTHRALYIGLVVLAAGITLIILYPVLADWPYYNLVTPIIVAVGAGVVAYSWRLVSRLPPQPDALPSPPGSPALRRMGLVRTCSGDAVLVDRHHRAVVRSRLGAAGRATPRRPAPGDPRYEGAAVHHRPVHQGNRAAGKRRTGVPLSVPESSAAHPRQGSDVPRARRLVGERLDPCRSAGRLGSGEVPVPE